MGEVWVWMAASEYCMQGLWERLWTTQKVIICKAFAHEAGRVITIPSTAAETRPPLIHSFIHSFLYSFNHWPSAPWLAHTIAPALSLLDPPLLARLVFETLDTALAAATAWVGSLLNVSSRIRSS